jgi:hypothetical protein
VSYSILYTDNGITKDISDFVTSIQYGGERQTVVRKLDVSVLSGTDAYIPRLELKKGAMLTLLSGSKELIRAVIFKEDRDDKGNVKITAYTHGIYLAKNKDTFKYEQQKASQIAQDICSRFGITAGVITDTKIILPKLIFREKTLWDMILISLTETTKQSGVKYRVFFNEGTLNIAEKQSQTVMWALEAGVNLLSANGSKSIEELRNQVKVTGKLPKGGNKELEFTVKNTVFQKLYGIMQEVREETGDGMTESKLVQIANTLLKELCREEIEADVEAIGIDSVESGMAVYVVEKVSGLTGSYYVEQDDHSIEGDKHTMRLKLSFTDEVPTLEYDSQ